MTPREHVIRVRCERGYSEGRDDDFAAADATFLLAALDQVTTQRDEIQGNRDALAHKVAEQRAVIARVRELHAPIPIYPGDCQSPDDEHGFDPAEEFCRDCPVEYEACGECWDEDGSWIEWPCETALAVDPNQWVDRVVEAALDGADTTTTDGSES